MISVNHINKSFGALAVLKDVCFSTSQAEVVSIVGASGAGKSTLLQVMGSLLKPDSGNVSIDGVDIYSLNEKELAAFRNRKIGFVFQSYQLLPEFTAIENVMLPALIAGIHKKNAHEKASMLLEEMGLAERINHKPSELSGGEAQRVAIARALVNNPSVLFADEPSGNLDSKTKTEIHNLFFKLREKYSVTVIIVTHDRELASMSDRIVEISDGRISL